MHLLEFVASPSRSCRQNDRWYAGSGRRMPRYRLISTLDHLTWQKSGVAAIRRLEMPGYKIAMVAACPFPANYGSPGAVREMAQSLAQRGNEVHVVTYPFGEDLPTDQLTIWRCSWWKKKSPRIY